MSRPTLDLIIGSLGLASEKRRKREGKKMSDKPTILVGAQIGGVAADRATDPHIRPLRNLLTTYCLGPYSPEVDEFSLVIRVDGDIGYWNQEGCDRMRRSKKERYITIDIYVPRSRWEGVRGIEIRKYLAACVEEAFQKMIRKLEKDKVVVDGDALLRDFAIVKKKYLDVEAANAWLLDPPMLDAPDDATTATVDTEMPEKNFVKTLYKWVDGILGKRSLHYEEAWTYEGTLTHHWGKVGHKGRKEKIPLAGQRPSDAGNAVLSKAMAEGYAEIPDDELKGFVIEYEIEGMGTTKDLDKLVALDDHMNDLLGWVGLGHCDGHSIGSGTMEVTCYVVDLDLATKCVKKDLARTPFADYSAIKPIEAEDEEEEAGS